MEPPADRMPPPPAAALPDDLLSEVLRRLAPRCLAASRSEFFARRPSTGTAAAAISGDLDFLPTTTTYGSREYRIMDHCNGLLLVEDAEYVANPATRWWARLPPCPPPRDEMDYYHVPYLVFDPAMSPQHYENIYQVIKPPECSDRYLDFYLGRSEKGVYLTLYRDRCLKVWILDETCSKMKWELKHDKDMKRLLLGCNNRQGIGSWDLQDINYRKTTYYTYEDDNMEAPDQKKVECEPNKEAALEKFEWISDDENVLDNEDRVTGGYHGYLISLGFIHTKRLYF
uniref:F-box associated domain-containing protein n=1 Tax=Oryza punctata TaxID=4537 RepID=A0A0E0KH82_ORYPU